MRSSRIVTTSFTLLVVIVHNGKRSREVEFLTIAIRVLKKRIFFLQKPTRGLLVCLASLICCDILMYFSIMQQTSNTAPHPLVECVFSLLVLRAYAPQHLPVYFVAFFVLCSFG